MKQKLKVKDECAIMKRQAPVYMYHSQTGAVADSNNSYYELKGVDWQTPQGH